MGRSLALSTNEIHTAESVVPYISEEAMWCTVDPSDDPNTVNQDCQCMETHSLHHKLCSAALTMHCSTVLSVYHWSVCTYMVAEPFVYCINSLPGCDTKDLIINTWPTCGV